MRPVARSAVRNPAHRLYAGAGKPAGFSGYFAARFDRPFKSGRSGRWVTDRLGVVRREGRRRDPAEARDVVHQRPNKRGRISTPRSPIGIWRMWQPPPGRNGTRRCRGSRLWKRRPAAGGFSTRRCTTRCCSRGRSVTSAEPTRGSPGRAGRRPRAASCTTAISRCGTRSGRCIRC